MAQNSALASAGNELVDAAGLLELTLPVQPTQEPEPTLKPVAPKQAKAPETVRIGSEDLTPAQIEQRLKELDPLAEVGRQFQQIAETRGPEAAQAILNYALEVQQNGVPDGAPDYDAWLVSPVHVPDNAETPLPLKWEDMDPDLRYLYAHSEARFEQAMSLIADQTKIIKGLQQQLGMIGNVTAESQLIESLKSLGVPATAETVAAMRKKGIDPRTAMKDPQMLEWMRQAHKAKPQPKREAVPEAPGASSGENVFDLDDPKLTTPQKMKYIQEGATPIAKDPEDVKRFMALAEEYGFKKAS